jgi:exopolysaccharide production protein ExoY
VYRSDSTFTASGERLPRDEVQLKPAVTRGAFDAFAKRLVDISGSVLFFALFLWLFLAVAVGVALTTGRPVIYRHLRSGRGGEKFACLKFRSMVVNSDELLQKYLNDSPEARSEWARDFKLKQDPRVTRFGRFLRRSSLDELPQFWNVLKGDMSLVGPRPVTSEELTKYYGGHQGAYFSVKPGITGLWQVNGRSDLSYTQRVELDAEYVRGRSFRGDLKILWKTIFVAASGRGSH